MCHTSGNEKLFETVYQPTRRQRNIAQARFKLDLDAAQDLSCSNWARTRQRSTTKLDQHDTVK
jgi:hypothetical protein